MFEEEERRLFIHSVNEGIRENEKYVIIMVRIFIVDTLKIYCKFVFYIQVKSQK